MRIPVGVNLAHGNTGLFTQCKNGPTGCNGGTPGNMTTCATVNELAGTGMDPTVVPLLGACGTNDLTGGGTGWLVTAGNIVPGEIIKVRIAIWDTSDGNLDSLAIIDKFEWSIEASEPGTVIY